MNASTRYRLAQVMRKAAQAQPQQNPFGGPNPVQLKMQQQQAAAQGSGTPAGNPEVMKAQQQVQMEQQKAQQSAMQAEQAAQQQVAQEQQKAQEQVAGVQQQLEQSRMEIERAKLQAETEKAKAELAQVQADTQVQAAKAEAGAIKAQSKAEAGVMKAQTKANNQPNAGTARLRQRMDKALAKVAMVYGATPQVIVPPPIPEAVKAAPGSPGATARNKYVPIPDAVKAAPGSPGATARNKYVPGAVEHAPRSPGEVRASKWRAGAGQELQQTYNDHAGEGGVINAGVSTNYRGNGWADQFYRFLQTNPWFPAMAKINYNAHFRRPGGATGQPDPVQALISGLLQTGGQVRDISNNIG